MNFFVTFSWGEYPFSQKFKTIKSVQDTGNKIIWKDLDFDNMSCAKGRNLACQEIVKIIEQDETFVLIDRDMFVNEYEEVRKLPFGVVGVYGRDVNVDKDERRLYGERTDNYRIPSGYVDISKPVSSVLSMSRSTLEYVGLWDETLGYSDDFWGMEDSEWLVRCRSKGCEVVKIYGIEFGHFDHWIDEEHDMGRLVNLRRRHSNSVRLFEAKSGVDWKRYTEAQEGIRRFLDE